MPLSRRPVSPVALALVAAAALSLPGAARASDIISVAPGLSLGVTFGQKVAFSAGFDLHATVLLKGSLSDCSSGSRVGTGLFAQASWLSIGAFRFAGGLHAGGELIPSVYALDGEVGYTYHTRYDELHPAQHGIHFGALGSLVPLLMDFVLRAAPPLGEGPSTTEATLAVGLHYPPPFGFARRCPVLH